MFAVCALHRSVAVVERCEMNPVACGNGFNLLDAPWSDEASSLGEGFEAALQREGHAFEQTSMHHVGEGMPVQHAMKIGREAQSGRDLSQAAEK